MPKTKPVTEVTSASEIANLRWYEQGDSELQTTEMLELRASLRRDRVVLQELNAWWEAALSGSFAEAKAADADTSYEDKVDASGSTTGIDKHRYCAIMTKMGLALLEDDEPQDVEEAKQQAREAWEEDSRGRETLTRKRWLDSIFELADTWTVGVENLEYASFLRGLFERTARKEAAGELGVPMVYWRDDTDVAPMPSPPAGSSDESDGGSESGDTSDGGSSDGRSGGGCEARTTAGKALTAKRDGGGRPAAKACALLAPHPPPLTQHPLRVRLGTRRAHAPAGGVDTSERDLLHLP